MERKQHHNLRDALETALRGTFAAPSSHIEDEGGSKSVATAPTQQAAKRGASFMHEREKT